MPRYQVIFKYVVPSRTSSRKATKIIEAEDIAEARDKADNDPRVIWGYLKVVDIIEASNH